MFHEDIFIGTVYVFSYPARLLHDLFVETMQKCPPCEKHQRRKKGNRYRWCGSIIIMTMKILFSNGYAKFMAAYVSFESVHILQRYSNAPIAIFLKNDSQFCFTSNENSAADLVKPKRKSNTLFFINALSQLVLSAGFHSIFEEKLSRDMSSAVVQTLRYLAALWLAVRLWKWDSHLICIL